MKRHESTSWGLQDDRLSPATGAADEGCCMAFVVAVGGDSVLTIDSLRSGAGRTSLCLDQRHQIIQVLGTQRP